VRRNALTATAIAIAWVVARTLMLLDLWRNGSFITSDVSYYHMALRNPNAAALTEYPVPILWLMRAINAAASGNYDTFFTIFVAFMVALDALATVFLFWRVSVVAAGFWVVFLALLGPIMWFRIDLIPAVAVTFCLIEVARHPRFSGSMLAVGAAAKLWPALLILPLGWKSRDDRRRLVAFGVVGGALALASLIVTGWQRTISPIVWQSQRGLQIESLAATWAMIKHASPDSNLIVEMSPHNAYEIYGPGVATWQTVATVALAAAVVYTVALAILLARRHHARTSYAAVVAVTSVIVAMIAADKTFSPQYLIWLAGPLGLTLALAKSRSERRWATVAAALGLATAGVTQLVFPLMYGGLLGNPIGAADSTALLVARNALMVTLTLWLMLWALRSAIKPR